MATGAGAFAGLSRRTVMLGAGGVVGVGMLGFSAAGAYKYRPTTIRVRQILVKEFGKRVVSGRDADRFIHDVSKMIAHPAAEKRVKGAFFELPPRVPRISYFPARRVRDIAVTLFVTRTNAYRVFIRQDRKLVYLSLDPYEAGCGNFLSAAYRPA